MEDTLIHPVLFCSWLSAEGLYTGLSVNRISNKQNSV